MARVYWVTGEEVYLADENGNRVFEDGDGSIPAPPSDYLAEVLKVRFIIGDPIGTSLIYADVIPATALEGQVYTTGNGIYHKFVGGGAASAWETCTITLDDQSINSFRGGTVWERAKRAFRYIEKD